MPPPRPYDSPAVLAEYAALTQGAGVADLSQRTQIELTGADRATFLHNMCTNEVRKLPAGSGCEAFLTDAHGHILAFVNIFVGAESIVLETVPGQEEKILAHLDRYLIREQVALHGRGAEWGELLVAGARAESLVCGLAAAVRSPQPMIHARARIDDVDVDVRRVDLAGAGGLLLSMARGALPAVQSALHTAGAVPCAVEAVEIARIEAGTPCYGVDITDKNLPQEVARDDRAISFVKGCYIGQETVARIDALGHVNKTLVGVRFFGAAIPPHGAELTAGGQTVGHVTSAAYSPRLAAPLALAYVRRGHNAPGSELESAAGRAVVVRLPLLDAEPAAGVKQG